MASLKLETNLAMAFVTPGAKDVKPHVTNLRSELNGFSNAF